jgi:hypothetical protein
MDREVKGRFSNFQCLRLLSSDASFMVTANRLEGRGLAWHCHGNANKNTAEASPWLLIKGRLVGKDALRQPLPLVHRRLATAPGFRRRSPASQQQRPSTTSVLSSVPDAQSAADRRGTADVWQAEDEHDAQCWPPSLPSRRWQGRSDIMQVEIDLNI